jgi:hypothetical protein
MISGFEQAKPAHAISKELAESCGVSVSPRTVRRRAAEWAEERDRIRWVTEAMDRLLEQGKKEGKDVSEMIIAMAKELLQINSRALVSADPLEVQRLGLAGESLRLRARQVDVQEHRLELQERRQVLVEEREKLAIAALEEKGKGEELSPEERIARVRAIYGLNDGTTAR